ncbi:MAG: DUF5011 domain-containing protein, partial [Candidatus Pacebacteria bacterium]|nr:DUF5011 domain-containing protein [Candidatus Paceibacterota bacterium]
THIASLVVENLTIGSSEKPNGITLYDEGTGEPYCVKILNGSLISVAGACSVATTTPDSPEGDSGGQATTTPEADTEPPVITINGNNPANINIGTTYNDLGATVTDNVNGNLGLTTYLDGTLVTQITLNTASSTTYTIDYTATDQAGNSATSTRTVIVSDPNVVVVDTTDETADNTASSTPQATEETATSTPSTTENEATSTPSTEENISSSTPQT